MLLLFVGASAQVLYTNESNSDSYISGWDNFGGDRSVDQIGPATLNMEPENFKDSYVPVGSGMIITLCLGAGYAMRKRKKSFKSLPILLLCTILLCGCHKAPIEPEHKDTVQVTFTPPTGRSSISPEGIVNFTAGDILHMWASGNGTYEPRYLGSIANSAGSLNTFTGTVKVWGTGETLSFYYIGVNTPNQAGTTYIDFSDQTTSTAYGTENEMLANIARHYHVGRYQTVAPDDAVTNVFYGTLHNMMALGVFDTSEFGDASNVKIVSTAGLNNLVKINIDGSIEYALAGIDDQTNISGHIVIGKGMSKAYVALLPKTENIPAEVSLRFISNNKVSTSTLDIEIAPNYFIHPYTGDNSIIGVHIAATDYVSPRYIDFPSPEECLVSTHLFTVYSEGGDTKKVVFSQGNLVYDGGRFKQHKNPWEICELTGNSDISVTGTFDRFGWCTSGHNSGNYVFQPYANSVDQYPGSIGYGYGAPGSSYRESFYPDARYRKNDWGWYQFGMHCFDEYPISGGNDSYWRSVGRVEWTYLFNERVTSSSNLMDHSTGNYVTNARFAKCSVEGVKGIVLFPDTYVHPDASLEFNNINSCSDSGYSLSSFSAEDFWTLHEAGVEFFPIMGYWDKSTESLYNDHIGYYWSCKAQTADKGQALRIGDNVTVYNVNRYQGMFVRLVFQTEGSIF